MTKKKIYFTTEAKKIEAANKLSDSDVEELRFLGNEVEALLKSKVVTSQNVQKLDNLINQLLNMRSRHVFSLMAWLKQKYLVD